MGTPEEGEEGLLMDIITGRDGDVDNWKEVILIYSSALKQIGTKLEILNDEFQHVHSYNPIEHIKSRIKTAESIVLHLRGKVKGTAAAIQRHGSALDTDVLAALTNLGYSIIEAQAAIQTIPENTPENLEIRIRIALSYFS